MSSQEGDRAPTLYDLAREAGVSLATASRVINGSTRVVAEPYRDRVLAAAERIGYRANRLAQATAHGTARLVALLVSDVSDPFFAGIAAGVSSAADRYGLLVTMATTGREPERERELIDELAALRPRVIVVAGSRRTGDDDSALRDSLAAARRNGSAVTLIGRNGLDVPSVRIADRDGAEAMARELVGLGHRRFAVLGGPGDLTAPVDRVDGFRAGVDAAGAELRVEDVIPGPLTRDGGYAEVMARGAAFWREFDAVFATADIMAIGALTAFRELGVDVPAELSLAGFDDIPPARDTYPALATVHVDLERLGESAVVHGMEPGEQQEAVIPAEVVIRASVRER